MVLREESVSGRARIIPAAERGASEVLYVRYPPCQPRFTVLLLKYPWVHVVHGIRCCRATSSMGASPCPCTETCIKAARTSNNPASNGTNGSGTRSMLRLQTVESPLRTYGRPGTESWMLMLFLLNLRTYVCIRFAS